MRRLQCITAVALLAVLAACKAGGVGPTSSEAVDTAATLDLVPISLTNSDAATAEALALCGVNEYRALVVGAAKVLRARDLPKYVRLTGNEPEIQTDAPAWVVAYQGVIRLPMRGTRYPYADQVDPTCVVVDGESYWYVTGEIRHPDGTVTVPSLVPQPSQVLPPLGS